MNQEELNYVHAMANNLTIAQGKMKRLLTMSADDSSVLLYLNGLKEVLDESTEETQKRRERIHAGG